MFKMTAPVFSSDIERIVNPNVSKLYELLHYEPAIPVLPEKNVESTEVFQPKTGKIYTPKTKPSNMQVKTVAKIRQQYEDDVYAYLPDDLVKIEEYFVNKVSSNSSRLDATKRVARKILRSSNSIDRQTWQILANLNPENKKHPLQYVLWNGVRLRVNGSRGGNTTFLVNCDLYEKKIRSISLNKKNKDHKKSLLQKSLSVKFKPGPLNKKKILDYSYQKFNVGSTELIKLPQIGLVVQPLYGVPIEPTISQVLFSLCAVNGKLTDKWAEFSVSALGEITSTKTSQLESNSVVFELDYKNDQNQILMRSDHRTPNQQYKKRKLNSSKLAVENDFMITQEVNILVNKLLDSVEINVIQDKHSRYDPDDRLTVETDLSLDSNGNQTKDKVKKRYGELEKLDVTVIRLPDVEDENLNKVCEKPYCSYGCVCVSLVYQHKFKNHCGRTDCMFICNCDISKLKHDTSFDGYFDILPGLMNLDTEVNSKLAKEEQKFHQTVLLTDDKSFVLKPQRRSTKAPKKYSEFFTDLNNDTKCNKILTINILKLQCENIEPWCMVHNLYKCFCRCRFTHSSINFAEYNNSKITASSENLNCTKTKICKVPIIELAEDESNTDSDLFNANANEARNQTCARIRRYRGRRYENYHYVNTHKRIEKLEKNDESLQGKLLKIVKSSLKSQSDTALTNQLSLEDVSDSDVAEPDNSQPDNETIPSDKSEQTTIPKNFPDMSKLIKWLEENYKFYKPRLQNGQKRFPLEAPKPGKIALYPWEVILDRYNSKKNYFLITQSEPYRLFMAVDLTDPVFKNCIKIDSVKFEDVPKYPITVRNLLQDASDMKDSFYILCGQSNCWELIGHVTKLGANNYDNNHLSVVSGASDKQVHVEIEVEKQDPAPLNELKQNEEENKWFLMLVGNDFREIQFIYRGFFIKYENIQKAIQVSRLSHKTVRLSSQKSAGFGIHAIPVEEHNCVFIGPYHQDESLGFETIGSSSDSECIVTSKGFWIKTEKTNNIELINNPILFLKNTCERLGGDLVNLVSDLNKVKALSEVPSVTKSSEVIPENFVSNQKRTLSLDGIENATPLPKIIKCEESRTFSKSYDNITTEKVVKPITIKKSGSFYKVNPEPIGLNISNKNSIKQLPPISAFAAEENLESFAHPNLLPVIQNTFSLIETPSISSLYSKTMHNKPVAEIAPQRKTDLLTKCIPHKHKSELLTPKMSIKNGMMILNPEEINKRILENQIEDTSSLNIDGANSKETALEDMDIENFLTTHSVCSPSEIDSEASELSEDDCKIEKDLDVIIECKDYDIGWIPGKMNKNYQLSFALPGFKFSEYYSPREAFGKINQVLSRKIYIPKEIELEWEIVHRKPNLNTNAMLHYEIDVKKLFLVRKTNNPATKTSTQSSSTAANAPSTSSDIIDIEEIDAVHVQETTKMIKDLELKSVSLEEELETLQSSVLLNKSELLKRLMQIPAESRELMRKKIFKF